LVVERMSTMAGNTPLYGRLSKLKIELEEKVKKENSK